MKSPKEVTIVDIAHKLGLSPATVSRALADHPRISKKTKKKITDLAEELGYRPNNFARNLREKKTKTLGVIVPKLNSYFMSSVIAGMEDVVQRRGYHLIISQSSESLSNEKENIQTMYNGRVDGLLVSVTYETKNLNYFDPFFKKNIPVIFFDRVVDKGSNISVLIDNKKAAYEATTHLIQNGCKNLLHISVKSETNVYRERLMGFRQALEDNGIPFTDTNLLDADLSFESGEAAAEKILKMPTLPDGVFVANDNCAVGCMVALKKQGVRLPGDIAFVGFNNDPVSKVIEPNLTTINYPGYEIGVAAATSLILHLEGTTSVHVTDTVILRSELIVRDSSVRNRS